MTSVKSVYPHYILLICHITSYHVPPHPITSHSITSYPTTSYLHFFHITSYPTTLQPQITSSYHILSNHILSHQGMGVGRGSSTQVLIGDYSSQYPGGGAGAGSRAPLRTPLQENIIMQEARNQLAFRDMTPLAGMGLGCEGGV